MNIRFQAHISKITFFKSPQICETKLKLAIEISMH